MTVIGERHRARLYIYTKRKTNYHTFLYTKSQTLFKKQKKFCYVLINIKLDTLHYTILHEMFEAGIFIQKGWYFALGDVLYTKSQTLGKKQDNLRYVFIYKNSDTLPYAIFHWIFETGGGGGGHFYSQKQCTFPLHFYTQKSIHFLLHLYEKGLQNALNMFIFKNNALFVTFLYLRFIV